MRGDLLKKWAMMRDKFYDSEKNDSKRAHYWTKSSRNTAKIQPFLQEMERQLPIQAKDSNCNANGWRETIYLQEILDKAS